MTCRLPVVILPLLLPFGAAAALELTHEVWTIGGSFAEEGADRRVPSHDYYAYVCAESEDEVALVRFGPGGTEVVKTISVGSFPAEIEGPHGISVAPDGGSWYVSISHGFPYGSIHKYATGTDEWEGSVAVGLFPATLDIAASTGLLFVVNSDFFGEHEPSTISVVETSTMTEVAQIPTGVMPHGARFSSDGRRFYSVNMMDDTLVEVDALRFEVARTLDISPHALGLGRPSGGRRAPHHGGGATGGGVGAPLALSEPTWVSPPTASGKLFVAGLSADHIVEVDAETLEITRLLGPTAKGPYNLAVTPDERLLVVTYKKADAIGFWDLERGVETRQIPTSRRIPHGVAITSDGRYSFVTAEGVGGEPGVLEIFDNASLARVGSVELGKQAGGIALWEQLTR